MRDVPDLFDLADDAKNLYRAGSVRRVLSFLDRNIQAAFYWKLEFHPDHGLHVHIVMPAPVPKIAHVARQHVRAVDDLPKLLGYLSKPADARCTRPKPHARKFPDAEKLEARRVYDQSRAALWKRQGVGAKLPRLSGVRGLTRS
jgi:hypothetical protein